MFKIGVSLLILGTGTKAMLNTYKKIKNKEFFNPASQANRQHYKGGFADPMTRREAQLILGLREGVTQDQIKKRHRKLMILNHPDSQGSTYIATKVNEAKDLLLKS